MRKAFSLDGVSKEGGGASNPVMMMVQEALLALFAGYPSVQSNQYTLRRSVSPRFYPFLPRISIRKAFLFLHSHLLSTLCLPNTSLSPLFIYPHWQYSFSQLLLYYLSPSLTHSSLFTHTTKIMQSMHMQMPQQGLYPPQQQVFHYAQLSQPYQQHQQEQQQQQ